MLQGLLNYISDFKERVTKGVKVITNEHALIHAGEMFYAYSLTSINAGATLKFTFTTPAVASGKYIHFRPAVISTSGDKLTMTMTEIPTSISGGSDVTAYNRNRLSTTTALSTLKTGVTLTESATVVDVAYVGGGTGVGSVRSGAETGEQNEVVLKQNTVYSITLTNNSSAANIVFLKMMWYEEASA